MTFAEWLKQTRTARGMTLKDLAVATGCAIGHIHDTENGKSNPTIATASKLCNGLGFKLWQVLKAIEP